MRVVRFLYGRGQSRTACQIRGRMQAEYVPEIQWRHRAVRSRPARPGERKPHERFPAEWIASPDRAMRPWANRLWRPARPVLFPRPDVFRPAKVGKGLGNEGARERLSRSGGQPVWLVKRQRARGGKWSATLSIAWDSGPPSPLARGRQGILRPLVPSGVRRQTVRIQVPGDDVGD